MAGFQSILFKSLTRFSSMVAGSQYGYQTGVWHEYNDVTGQHILWGQEYFGSGSDGYLVSVATCGGNPVSFVDNNYPTVEITEEQSNLLATASINQEVDTITDWLEDNYFYQDSSPATASVQIGNEINNWLLSGSLADVTENIEITTIPQYNNG